MPDLLGAHMSIAGGVYRALERGLEVGCSVVQIFLKNQLRWTAAPYTEEDIRRFSKAWKATRMRTVFAHSSYLINLAAPAATEWKRAVAAFHDELERAETLGLPFVIIHPGSHRGEGLEAGIRRIVAALDELTASRSISSSSKVPPVVAPPSGGLSRSWRCFWTPSRCQSAWASASIPATSSPRATNCAPPKATRRPCRRVPATSG